MKGQGGNLKLLFISNQNKAEREETGGTSPQLEKFAKDITSHALDSNEYRQQEKTQIFVKFFQIFFENFLKTSNFKNFQTLIYFKNGTLPLWKGHILQPGIVNGL